MAPPVKLSSTHEMLMNWLLTNPEKSLRECADHFGYTQSWVSQIIHSDLFQHALKEKQERIFVRVADGIPAKLRRNADIALEKLSDHLEKSEDPEFILSATDKLLHRMGYAPQSARAPAGSPAAAGVGVQQNNFFLSQSDLAAARAQLQQGGLVLACEGGEVGSPAGGLVLDGEIVAEPSPAPGALE